LVMMEPGCKENTSMLVCLVLHTPERHTHVHQQRYDAGEQCNNVCEGSLSVHPGLLA